MELRRGRHLVTADRAFLTGGGVVARIVAPAFARVLDAIDAGLACGGIEATLPDGTYRRLGGRAPGPVAIVTLHSWRALFRLGTSGSVGWYRAWADGDWSSPDPVPLFDLFMRNRATLGSAARAKGIARLANRIAHALRRNSLAGARRNIAVHYDLGKDFYAAWLDPTMSYSSAVFAAPGDPLEAAQHRKVELLLDRVRLKAGDRLTEIGCGWGFLAEAAARRGAHVVGYTLSAEQKAAADARLAGAGLAPRADIVLRDYREMPAGDNDAIVSVEMVEAIGAAQWPGYMAAIARGLRPGGRAALQFITIDDAIFDAYAASVDFIQTYVFPGGMLVAERRFRAAAEAAGLAWEAPVRFGADYAETLRLWRDRFDRAVREGRLPRGFDDAFVRLWRYYLMYCEGGFRGGGIDVMQVTLVKR